MKSCKLKLRGLLLLIAVMLSHSFGTLIYAQSGSFSVSGVVSDNAGAVPGVSVYVKGSPTKGTITDIDGKYSIVVSSPNDTLVYSFIGMKTQVVPVQGRSEINVLMENEAYSLNEVVTVGYGTQKKKSLTSAVAQINDKEIKTTSATSLAQKLQGKVAGLNIRQQSGAPGEYKNSINIRGFGEPIFVIDGVRRGSSADFQRLNAEDIESISVLKDASAAIYGINAANGVIIVTTKKGGKGKAKFTYSMTAGFSSPTDMVTMANAAQYMELKNDADVNSGLPPFVTKEELDLWRKGGPGYESTDWYDETMKGHSTRVEHNLSAQGGNDNVSYFFSLGYIGDNGLLQSGDINYKKYSFRSNVTAKLTKNLTANVNISAFTDDKENPSSGFFNIIRGTISQLPTNPVYANNNPNYLNKVLDGQAMNPVAIAQSDLTGMGQAQERLLQTSMDLKYEVPFVKGLELKGLVSYDPRTVQNKFYFKDFKLYDYDAANDKYVPTDFNKPPFIQNYYRNSYLLTLQGMVNYKTVIADDHTIRASLIYEQREGEGRYAFMRKYYDFFTNPQLDQALMDSRAQINGNEDQSRHMSYIGRLNYEFKGKYLFEAAVRYDGSYRYAPDVRWGLFPSLSAGWVVSEESFLKDVSWLSNLKLRGSYGVIGQDAGAPFQYMPGFSTTGGGVWEFVNGTLTTGAASPQLVNKDLTWMENQIVDFGIDLGFFQNRLSATFDVYDRYRTGILAYRYVTIPNTFGGTLPQENLNSDRTKGFDLSVVFHDKVGDFSYSISANYNLGRTKNEHVEHAPYQSSWQRYKSGQDGRWQGIIWTYVVDGQFQNEEEILNAPVQEGHLGNNRLLPGDYNYMDLNGDGVIDGNDMVRNAYSPTPQSYYGLTFNGSWKGLDINILLQGASRFTARYTHAYTTMFWGEGNIPAYFMDRWHKEDPYNLSSQWVPGEWPAVRNQSMTPSLFYAESSVWRRKADYLRIKNVELGYTLDQYFLKNAGIKSIRVFASVNNLYTWADSFIKPFDPEKITGSESTAGLSTGWEYPLLRTFNVGLSVNF